MLAALHHNKNIEAEERGERIIERRSARIGRANNEPNERLHKTPVFTWQKELKFCRAKRRKTPSCELRTRYSSRIYEPRNRSSRR